MIAKWVSLLFALVGVFLFILQFLPTYIGTGVCLCIFIAGGIIWACDTLWGTFDDTRDIYKEIKDNQHAISK